MQFLIQYPEISSVIFSFEVFGMNIALRWYSLAYIAGIILGWRYIVFLIRRERLWATVPMTTRHVEDLMTWMVVGIIVGGRLGFVLFYNFGYYWGNPVEILKVWNGGMSFHGGIFGVIIATILFGWRKKLPVLSIGDAVAAAAPIGLLFGRLANFVNGELWGRPTTVPWAMIFPDPRAQQCPESWLDICARHPSQLYEAMFEGLVLFILILWLIWAKRWLTAPGRITGVFLMGYGVARFVIEYFRQPDAQFISVTNPLGHVINVGEWGITMGQTLSLPMIIAGVILIYMSKKRV